MYIYRYVHIPTSLLYVKLDNSLTTLRSILKQKSDSKIDTMPKAKCHIQHSATYSLQVCNMHIR